MPDVPAAPPAPAPEVHGAAGTAALPSTSTRRGGGGGGARGKFGCNLGEFEGVGSELWAPAALMALGDFLAGLGLGLQSLHGRAMSMLEHELPAM